MSAKAYGETAAVTGWAAPGPCDGCTVLDVANHLVHVTYTSAAAADRGRAEYECDDLVGAYQKAAA